MPVADASGAEGAGDGSVAEVEDDHRLAAAERGVHHLEAGERHLLRRRADDEHACAISAQRSSAMAPVAGTTPRAQPSLVTTAPGADRARGEARRAAATGPGRGGGTAHSSVCSQSSQPISAASAAPQMSATGNCRGSQLADAGEPRERVPGPPGQVPAA